MEGHDGKSGATLERVLLADGQRLVVKRFTPAEDLVMAMAGDVVGREYDLWSRGVLDALPPEVGHAVVDGWLEPDGSVLVQRDLGSAVLTWADRVSVEQCRWMLDRVATMHRAFLGRCPDGLTPLPLLIGAFAPARLAPHVDGTNPLPALAIRGWEILAETVASDVADPVLGLLDDMAPLVAAVERGPTTLLHGDLATVNMAVEGDRLTLIDWGMPAAGPGALDIARFLAGCSSVVDMSREDVLTTYAELAGPAVDESSVHVALLSAFCWLGWNKALDAAENPDPSVRDREQADLDWWVAATRRALDAGVL